MLVENKSTLRELHRKVRTLSSQVNGTKRSIDELKRSLQHKKEVRANQEAEDEPGVIDEEEFSCINQIKKCKEEYKAAFEEYREAKNDIPYIESLVESCRQQLVADFERWMRLENPTIAAHVAAGRPEPSTPPPQPSGDRADPDEEFEDMAEQMILTSDPDSLPFLKAAKHASHRGSPNKGNAVGRKPPDNGTVVKPTWA